jgi:hypothetical protein
MGLKPMKKILFSFIVSLALTGCGLPSSPKPAVTDTLTLLGPSTISGTGIFYNYSQGTTFLISFPNLPFSNSYYDFSHDTLGFSVTFSAPTTFTYQLDSSSVSATATPAYTSPRMQF